MVASGKVVSGEVVGALVVNAGAISAVVGVDELCIIAIDEEGVKGKMLAIGRRCGISESEMVWQIAVLNCSALPDRG